MCPKDEAHLVRKFNNYYIIFPSIQFINSSNIKNNLIITGKKVEGDFEYNSKNNKHFLEYCCSLNLKNEILWKKLSMQ